MDTPTAILALALAAPVTRYDVLERNTTLNDDGETVLEQFIAWDWDEAAGCHRAQWWGRAERSLLIRRGDCWRLRCDGVVIETRQFRETVTWGDPELQDRARWAVELRRGPRRSTQRVFR